MIDENFTLRRYGDIIDRPHPVSRVHKPMSIQDRAAQFAPFAALKGFEEEIERTREEEMSD